MPPTWTHPVPRLFGELPTERGLLFVCPSCTRGTAIGGAEACERWGKEGLVADVAKRFRCTNCGHRGAAVEVIRGKMFSRETIGQHTQRNMAPIDRFVAEVLTVKPSGTVT